MLALLNPASTMRKQTIGVIVAMICVPLLANGSEPCANEKPPAGYFCRMFWKSSLWSETDEPKVEKLGESMPGKTEPREKQCPGSSTVAAGYTYFGQLIDHDLLLDPVLLHNAATVEAEEIPNGRTPWLDLDQVYGGGPVNSSELYEGDPSEAVFKIGGTADLPMENGCKLIGDPCDLRDLENLVVLQMHVLFMKLHNRAIAQCMLPGLKEVGPENGTRFERARRLVKWQYQWLIENDYLHRTVNADVLRRVRTEGSSLVFDKNNFQIPVEFSAAAFRFGHSMVRGTYKLNDKPAVSLLNLMSRKDTRAALNDTNIIKWQHFFRGVVGRSGTAAPSLSIDTSLAKDFSMLPPATIKLFGQPSLLRQSVDPERHVPALSARTLLRGVRVRLPSGQELAQALGLPALSERQLDGSYRSALCKPDRTGKVLIEQGLVQKTPLFYYILRESETFPTCGDKLGPMGSWIVAETIEGSLEADADSYVRVVGRDWVPPKWPGLSGNGFAVKRMSDLVILLGR
jgi:hypothetical protein